MRDTVLSKRDELAVDDGVGSDALERLCDLDVAAADDLATAAIERDFAALDLGDHAEAVVLVLENPVGIVERGVGQRGEHRLEAPWQIRHPAHAS